MGLFRPRHRDPHVTCGSALAGDPRIGRIEPADVIARTLRLYREHLRVLLMIAAVAFVPLGIMTPALGLLGRPGLVVSTVANLAAMFLVQGAIVWAVQRLRPDDEPCAVPRLADVLGASRGWFVPLAVAGVLAAASVIAGLALFIIPGLVLLTWWVVLPPVVVLERPGVWASFRRAHALVAGHAWRVFAIAVITMAIQLALSVALGLASSPLGAGIADVARVAVGNTLAAPLVAVAWTLTYFDLRALHGAASPIDITRPQEQL
jgi:hypothetical protein